VGWQELAVALLLERAARLENASLICSISTANTDRSPRRIATRLRLGGPADFVDAGDDLIYLPYWIFEIDELALIVLNADDPYAADQRLWLVQRIEAMKRGSLGAAGHYDTMMTATVDSPVPYRIQDLLASAERDEVEQIILQPSGKVLPGPYAGKLRSLINRIEARCADPRYAFISSLPSSPQPRLAVTDGSHAAAFRRWDARHKNDRPFRAAVRARPARCWTDRPSDVRLPVLDGAHTPDADLPGLRRGTRLSAGDRGRLADLQVGDAAL